MPFTLRGPKGGLLIRTATAARVAKALPGLIRRFKRVTVIAAPFDKRAVVVGWGQWGVRNEPRIHYTEGPGRDDWRKGKPGALPMSTDCSGFVTACYKWSGLPDPNGYNYKILGYTGTLLEHGRPVTEANVKPGDLVVYGPGTGVHTALIVHAGPDPLTVSHGQEAGPEYVHVSQDNRQPVRYLSFLP